MTKTLEQKLEDITAKYDEAYTAYRKAKNLLDQVGRQREKVEKDYRLSKGHFEDLEWLVNNPDTPGQYEALTAYLYRDYGGKGIQGSGYRANEDYSKRQQAFDLDFYTEDSLSNIKDFLPKVVPLLPPLEGDYIDFHYGTGQHSGIHCVAFNVKDNSWYTYRTQWSKDKDFLKHESLDKALEFAVEKRKEIDDD